MPPRADAADLAHAADPRTSPDELTRLAAHDSLDVRLAVASNPATPRAVVDAMLATPGSSYGQQAVIDAAMGNASLTLWLLDDPDWLRRQRWDTALSMARSPALTPTTWEALLGHEADPMNGVLLSSPAAPADAWRRCGLASALDGLMAVLDSSEDETLVQILVVDVLEHPELPARLRDEPDFLRQSGWSAAYALAGSRVLTRELWHALRGHPSERTRLALLRSPIAPPDAWTALGLPSSGDWNITEGGLVDEALPDLAQRPQLAGLAGLRVQSESKKGLLALLRSPFLTGLGSLSIGGCALRMGDLDALGEAVFRDQLTSLDLSDNPLGREDHDALESLAPLGSLVSLDLSYNDLTDLHMELMYKDGLLDSLGELRLSSNRLTGSCLDALDSWATRAHPTSLSLAENRLGDAGVKRLAQSPSFASLMSLDLTDIAMSTAGAEELARSTTLANLTSLDLSDNPLGDAGVLAICRSTSLLRLTSLGLVRTGSGMTSMKALASATISANLLSLGLSDASVSDAGLEVLACSGSFPRLEVLDLQGSRMTAHGLLALVKSASLPHLRELNLRGSQVTASTIAALARASFQYVRTPGAGYLFRRA